jgi:hypothetical protein
MEDETEDSIKDLRGVSQDMKALLKTAVRLSFGTDASRRLPFILLDATQRVSTEDEKTMIAAVLEGLRRPSHSRPLVAKPMTMRAIHDTKPLLKKAPTGGSRRELLPFQSRFSQPRQRNLGSSGFEERYQTLEACVEQ